MHYIEYEGVEKAALIKIACRWRKAGVWDRLMDAIVKMHDGDVQMIDTSVVRVHQQGAMAKRGIEIDV